MIMGGLREHDRVLIHSAAGGVGTAATQIARNAGAEIFGTASAAKHDAIRAQGVHHAIDYRTEDFQAEVRRLTDGAGVDVVLDALGPTSFRKDYRILRPGGKLIMCGLSEAQNEQGRNLRATVRSLIRIPTSTMPWWNAARLLNQNRGVFGLNLLSWWRREGGMDRITRPLLADLGSGRLVPVVDRSFPFTQTARRTATWPSGAGVVRQESSSEPPEWKRQGQQRCEGVQMPRVAVIGCGSVSVVHFEAIKAIPGAELVAVCDSDAATLAAAAAQHGVPGFADHRQLLDAGAPGRGAHLHAP